MDPQIPVQEDLPLRAPLQESCPQAPLGVCGGSSGSGAAQPPPRQPLQGHCHDAPAPYTGLAGLAGRSETAGLGFSKASTSEEVTTLL